MRASEKQRGRYDKTQVPDRPVEPPHQSEGPRDDSYLLCATPKWIRYPA